MNNPINISVESDIYDLKKYSDLTRPISDHALIRVEFNDFVIYSYNLLNGDDKIAFSFTLRRFTETKKNKYNRDLDDTLTEFFYKTNLQRTKDMCDILLRKQEDKPIIFCFQEVGERMEAIIREKFQEIYDILSSEIDVVGSRSGELIPKHEKRLTLVPKTGVEHTYDKYKIEANGLNEIFHKEKPYKSAIGVNIFGCYIINIHVNWQSSFDQLLQFLEEVKSIPNLIIIGDFNTSLDDISGYLKDNDLNVVKPDRQTFISKMILPGGTKYNQSNIVDQVIYNIRVEELVETTPVETTPVETTPVLVGGSKQYFIKYNI